jgi:signal peptidase I
MDHNNNTPSFDEDKEKYIADGKNTDTDSKSDTSSVHDLGEEATAEINGDITVPDIDASHDDSSQVNEEENTDKTDEKKPSQLLTSMLDFVEIFTLSIVAVLLVFSFAFRLCRVDGDSMNNTLLNNEMLVTTDLFYTPKQGDVVVFHLSNDFYAQPLVKRVIATEGQTVMIDFTEGRIYVDGKEMNDPYAFIDGGQYAIRYSFNQSYIHKENGKVYFEATVPKGKIFVLGDNRNHSSDSRASTVGFVDVDCVLGKALFRISPFTILD